MREPVITPCGITYDRKDIEEHLQVILCSLIAKTFLFMFYSLGFTLSLQSFHPPGMSGIVRVIQYKKLFFLKSLGNQGFFQKKSGVYIYPSRTFLIQLNKEVCNISLNLLEHCIDHSYVHCHKGMTKSFPICLVKTIQHALEYIKTNFFVFFLFDF